MYALDVNVEGAEDVVTHQPLLDVERGENRLVCFH
jgi:hypothetical protein